MADDEPIVTPCPRCGRSIEWAAEVAHQGCACPLTRAQWADLAERAERVQEGREG